MPVLYEGKHAGEYLVWEASPIASRETVTLVSGQNLVAGTVLGQITASKKYTQHSPAAADGSQNAVAVLYDNVNATAGDKKAVITARLTAVNGSEITWPSGITTPQMTAAQASLAAQFIVIR